MARRGSVRATFCSGIVRLCQVTVCSTSVDFSKIDFWQLRSPKYPTVRRTDESIMNCVLCGYLVLRAYGEVNANHHRFTMTPATLTFADTTSDTKSVQKLSWTPSVRRALTALKRPSITPVSYRSCADTPSYRQDGKLRVNLPASAALVYRTYCANNCPLYF